MTSSSETIEKTLGLDASAKQPLKKYLWFFGLFVVIVIASAFGWKKYTTTEEIIYITAPLEIKTLTTTVSATGNIEPTNTVDVGIEVSGTISEVLVDYNDQVHIGQVMARLDTTKLTSKVVSSKAFLSKSQASILEAKAILKNSQNEWERVRTMYTSTGGNYPSKQEMDNVSTTVEKGKAQVAAAVAQSDQATAQLNADQDDLRKAVVISPVNGIVLERKVEPGQTVVASMQTPILFKMAEDLTKMRVIVSVDEADVGEVKENQKVEFSVDAYPDRRFEGKITQLRMNSAVVNGVVTYEAVVEVHNDNLLLRPGMTANASIVTGIFNNVAVIPNAALRFTPPILDNGDKKKYATRQEDKGHYVWIVKNKTPTKIKVNIGRSDGVMSIVQGSTLKSGDLVITGVEEQP
jgi:HlyD family secretion protein